jgi:hypothetical protein
MRRADQADRDEWLQPAAAMPDQRATPARQPWRGAGGRWLVWPLRIVAWGVLLLIGYRGVAAIVAGPSSATPPPAAAPSARFPVTLAEAYALEFGAVYLNFSPATAAQRASQLAAFLPAGAARQLGWNGAGTEQVQSEQVASISVRSQHAAVVTLLARVSGRLLELGVPVYSAGHGMVVSGQPALLPAPSRPVPPGSALPGVGSSDPAATAQLEQQLPAFFRAYASGAGTTLDRFLASGAKVTGLGGAVRFGSIQSVIAPTGGATRAVTVSVTWLLPSSSGGPVAAQASGVRPATLDMTYRLTVVRRAATWYVQSIGAAPDQSGSR